MDRCVVGEAPATDFLQKSLNQTRKEKIELEGKVKELEARVAELVPAVEDVDATEESESEAA